VKGRTLKADERAVNEACGHWWHAGALEKKEPRARGEDQLLDAPTATRFDREEWGWR